MLDFGKLIAEISIFICLDYFDRENFLLRYPRFSILRYKKAGYPLLTLWDISTISTTTNSTDSSSRSRFLRL